MRRDIVAYWRESKGGGGHLVKHGGDTSAFHGVDTARFLQGTLAVLHSGNTNIDIGARIQNDNSIVVAHVLPINSASQERRPNGLLESNREELATNPRTALSHIMAP